MRIAFVSDIHGNLPALEAVWAEIARNPVDIVVNLGDIVSGPLWPRETAKWLMALDLPTIAGNHERQLLTLPRERMNESDRFAADALADAQWAWLRSVPAAHRIEPDVLCCHGTPGSDLVYLLETTTPDYRRDGLWHAQLCCVPYDHEAATRRAERNGRAEWAHALRTGYALAPAHWPVQ